ncbi:exophilin-5 isoform X3 [Sciurus carolinensis]|uniref:exophilin-5 isoform X3 n=1 Tax=Sciurus carolinensis TaxID=30640 RepID=UPI001FB431F7|nr:exophilin-5 isoform X3 [Sciurus carolinensis]
MCSACQHKALWISVLKLAPESLRREGKPSFYPTPTSKLQKTKRDIRWLQGVTGEWFEEIQRKKFCNETDISQMLKQPLTHRLRKGMAKNDPMELQTSRSKTLINQKKPTSVPSRPSFRSSFASLFSFRKPGKETLKLQALEQKRCDGHVGPPGSTRGTTVQAKIHSSPLENQPVDSAFVPTPAIMRVGSGMPPPWDASVLESEFFQVLDDLDSTLAQEQSASSVNSSIPLNYGSRTPFSRSYSSGNRHGTITGTHKHRYNETSNMSIYEILRPGTPREGFKTFSPRTRTICDMYRTREPRVLKEDYAQKNTLGSTSVCFESRQRSASPATRHFTARSLHFPATTQNKSRFIPSSHQQTPKRTPLSSIIWNRSDPSGDRQNQEEFLRAPSPMEMDPADQYMYPRCFQENRRYEFYHSQNVFQSASLNAHMDNAMSPDAFENSENMPFYHQDNPFARSFFSNTFRQSREQRFGQSSFWNQQKEYSPWSDFHPCREPFTSDRDFEMISIEANSVPAVHGHSIPSQHWEPFSSRYGTNLFRGQEEPHLRQPDFQSSPPESMEISPGNEDQSIPHLGTPNVYSRTGSGYHIKSSGLECRQDSSPGDVLITKEPYSFGIAQTLVSSLRNPFSQIPDEQGNSRSPNFQNSTVTLQKIIPNNPDTIPVRNHVEDTVTDSNSIDSLSLAESQPNIFVTEMNNEKNLNESILDDKQLNRMDQTNMMGEIPQPVAQTVISNPLPDSQNSLTQDSAKSNRFNFNVPTKISSKRSPRVFSRKDTSQIYTSHREKDNELKKEKSFSRNKELGSTTSFSFTQESRTPPSFLSPNQDCHQELTVGSEDISNVIKNYHWYSEPTDTQNTQTPEKPVISDTEGEQCPTTHSTNCSKLFAGNNSSSGSSVLSSGAPPDSLPSNNSFLDGLVIPSTTVFSKKSPSDKDLFLGESEEKDNASKNQNDQFAVSPSGNQKSTDSHMPIGDEVVDVVKCHSYSPFRKGKGRVRRRISCIEKLSKIETRSIPISEGNSLFEENQSNSKVSEFSTIYCTLPRKSASFLINSRQPESKIMAASIRNGPLPFQIRNNVEDPIRKYTSSKFSPGSPESMSECSKVISDSIPMAPEDTERKTCMKVIQSASVRKGPLPFLIKRAMSCPLGEPCASTGKDERKKSSVSDTDTSAVTPRPWEKMVNSLEHDSFVRDCSLTKRHHSKELSPECTEKDGETIASRTSVFSLSNEDPLPFCEDLSGKESGNTLHKFKTTSMFSVSGDEDNVKCLEVVSIYYTLPRKPSKKFCDLLQRYTQNASPLTESPQVEAETFPNDLERDEPNHSPQDQSETPSSEDLKVPVNSAQSYLSHTTENMAVLKSSNRGSSEMASVGVDVSFHKGESRTRKISPDNLAKTPLGDLQCRKEKGEKRQSETLHTSLMLQERNATKEKSESSINAGNSGPSGLPAHLEDNVENSQTTSSRECAGSGIDFIAMENGEYPQKDHTEISVDNSSSGSQPRAVRGRIETDCQKRTDKMLSDSESQVFALIPAFHKLQVVKETHSGEQDLENLESEPRGLPQGSQEVNITESRKVKDEMQKLPWDQTLLLGGSIKNKTNMDDLEKAENRSLVKHRLVATSKANRKFPTKDSSPRRHVATIFPQSGSNSGFGHLSFGNLECDPLSPESTPKSTSSTDESCLSNNVMDTEKSENTLQGITFSRETSSHSCDQKSDNISQLYQHEFQNVSESPPKHENSKDLTVAQILERESGNPTQPTFTSLREVDFSDHQKRLSPPFPLEPAQKSTTNLSLASCQQQQRSASSPERESEPHLYRSKSLKNINVLSDQPHISGPPKVRERHFSESTSIDNALSQMTLGNEFSTNAGYGRRFKSFSELPSCDENESWALYRSRTKTGPKSASSISRPIDYGIFGKEQQLAFLENVKRSLTQGRLWKPSFLKNPGFLKDDVINPSNTSESLNSNSPSSQVPKDVLFPNEPLNIYEEDPVDSDCDTDTTTDDEYYLDENDKESEL